LHRAADRVGLVAGLRGALVGSPWRLDRANVLVIPGQVKLRP
jgi:hypothetical protein